MLKSEISVAEVEEWREKFLLGAENALRSRPRAGLDESGESERRTVGNGCDAHSLRARRLGPSGRRDRLS